MVKSCGSRIYTPHGRGLWRKILIQWPRFQQCIKWNLCRGNKISFWEDEWLGEGCLMRRYPRIYAIAQNKKIAVEEAYRVTKEKVKWSVFISRNLNDWEISEYGDLLKILEAQQLKTNDDLVVWKLEKKGEFSVTSYCRFLCARDDTDCSSFPAVQIWMTKAPPRIAFFAWEGCWEKILTIDKFSVRGQILINGCYCCFQAEETCNHLLLWCPMPYNLWCMVHGLLGIEWVIAGSVGMEICA
ncbi:uncharacterized protein LOC110825801 [Carica papaya]|uniref:uncharacterized protein LOC110825801 n=1 Tax=Carica papaya TaxID=3649 RepID=UPI000B8D1635|nr:uncharacterized protein LOC110825801 [Carica papaya]